MRYIFVFEDGSISQNNAISDGDKVAVDSGILDIVDTETGKQYYNGEWTDLPTWGDVQSE